MSKDERALEILAKMITFQLEAECPQRADIHDFDYPEWTCKCKDTEEGWKCWIRWAEEEAERIGNK